MFPVTTMTCIQIVKFYFLKIYEGAYVHKVILQKDRQLLLEMC